MGRRAWTEGTGRKEQVTVKYAFKIPAEKGSVLPVTGSGPPHPTLLALFLLTRFLLGFIWVW